MPWICPHCNYYSLYMAANKKLADSEKYLHLASEYQKEKRDLEEKLKQALAENQYLQSENTALNQDLMKSKWPLQDEIKQLQQELAQVKRDLASEKATKPWALGNPYVIAHDAQLLGRD